jgi:hypothetical protein
MMAREMDEGYYYDINSSFPFSMTLPQPGTLKVRRKSLRDALDDDVPLVLADCEVEVPESYLPSMPYRWRNKIYFPTGRWRSWFTGIDLRALLERGGKIHSTHDVYLFHPFTDMADYVAEIYNRRKKAREEGDAFRTYTYKILLNSLYGKFAEGREKTSLLINPTREQRDHYGLYLPETEEEARQQRCHQIILNVWSVPKTVTVPHEHVPIASNVTAHSRLMLLRHLERAPRENGDVFYCDTDGFATNVQYPTGPEVGELKLEARITSASFYAPKVCEYNLDDGTKIHKAKGFSLPSRDADTRERAFRQLVDSGLEIERMIRPMEMLKRKTVLQPCDTKILKRLLMLSPKRHFFQNGKSRPWTIEEITGRATA